MDERLLVGRVLLALPFLVGGIMNLDDRTGTAEALATAGVPGAGGALAFAAGLAEVVAAMALLAGWRTRLVTTILAVDIAAVTWFSHLVAARAAVDPAARDGELLAALGNAAILGGLLVLGTAGPGRHSVDRR